MKNSPRRKRRVKLIKYPVPEWMQEELKPIAEKLSILERHTLAEKYEKMAAQLREMGPPEIPFEPGIMVYFRPNMKRAIISFSQRYGAKHDWSDEQKLQAGTRWYLEAALPLIGMVAKQTDQQIYYRTAEALTDSVYTEELISIALAKWEKQFDDDSEDQD